MRDYIVHLRLPFQILLSPIFLWGYLLASGKPSWSLFVAYLAFHIFGYAGGTALNSYYDRDEGPIGGLSSPPPVPRYLLPFSVLWQFAGFLLALTVNLKFAAIYFVMFWMSFAYSHPRTRWKGKPLAALATVALGQGVLAFLGGWAAARGDVDSAVSWQGVLGMLTATLLVAGLYPLTGSYQIQADALRGDMTLARFLGIPRSFRFAVACLAIGGACGVIIAAQFFSSLEAALLLLFIAGLVIWITIWRARFDRQSVMENYRTTMRLYAATTVPFLAWTVYHLFLT